jgi:putative MFS transporter
LYAPLLIGTFGIFGSETFIITAILYALGFVGALISMSWNDRFGRRPLQVMGFGLMFLGMALMAIALDLHGLLILVFGMAGLLLWYGIENIGPGNTVGLYAIELLPTKLRSTSMGSATAVTRFVSFMSAFEFPFIVASLGDSWFFYILLIVMLGAFIFTILFTPETRGITLDQMEDSVYRLHRIVPKQK